MRKNCSIDRENFGKFEAEDQEFSKKFNSLKQFIQTGNRMLFNFSWRFFRSQEIEQL